MIINSFGYTFSNFYCKMAIVVVQAKRAQKGTIWSKNPFKGPFGPIFWHRKGWGIKITSENFFEIGF